MRKIYDYQNSAIYRLFSRKSSIPGNNILLRGVYLPRQMCLLCLHNLPIVTCTLLGMNQELTHTPSIVLLLDSNSIVQTLVQTSVGGENTDLPFKNITTPIPYYQTYLFCMYTKYMLWYFSSLGVTDQTFFPHAAKRSTISIFIT